MCYCTKRLAGRLSGELLAITFQYWVALNTYVYGVIGMGGLPRHDVAGSGIPHEPPYVVSETFAAVRPAVALPSFCPYIYYKIDFL